VLNVVDQLDVLPGPADDDLRPGSQRGDAHAGELEDSVA